MKLPKYPSEFFTYGNGAKISDEEINDWIGRCVFELSNEVPTYSISCGDTEVVANRYKNGAIEVKVYKNYSEYVIYPGNDTSE